MNLKQIKIHADNPDHFVVSHAGGAPFRVSKNGVDRTTIEKIQAHHAVQRLAEGGEKLPASDPDAYRDPGGGWSVGSALEGLGRKLGVGGQSPDDARMQASLAAYNNAQQAAPAFDPGANFLAAAKGIPGTMADDSAQSSPPAPPQTAAPQSVSAPDATPRPTPKPAMGPGGGALERDSIAANRQKGAAEDSMATIAGQKGAEQGAAATALARQIQENSRQHQEQFQKYQQRADETAAAIANGKIDPNHYFANRTTGQAIGGSIAMILGGLGAGWNGRANPVIEAQDKAIDRDIEAQKANLGKQQNLLSFYMQQGHNINDSAQLARADLKDYTDAMQVASASKYAGPEAVAAAQQAKANNGIETAKLRSNLRDQAQERDLKALQMQKEQMEMGMMQNSRGANIIGELGRVIPSGAGYLLPADRRVKTAQGNWALANSKDDQSKINDVRIAHDDVEAALREMEALKSSNALMPGGSLSRAGEQALQHYVTANKALQGKSGLGRTAEDQQVEKSIGNPTGIFRTSAGTQALIDQARKAALIHKGAVEEHSLVGGREAAAG